MMIAEADIIFSSLLSRPTLRLSPLMTSGRVCGSVKLMTCLSRRISEQGCLSPTLVSLPIQGRKLPKEVPMVMEVRRSPCWCSLERNV